MSFLAPLFLIGGAMIAAPILFHLIRRTSRERIPFSSLMFLAQSPPRVTRKSRLENILLLLLRCSVLALLAFAFARPFIRQPAAPETAAARRTVVLLDTSASMRRDGVWSEAKRRAMEIVAKAKPDDEVALMLFDRGTRVLVNFPEWASASPSARATLIRERLEPQQPGWGLAHLGNALTAAADLLDSKGSRLLPAEIVILSDASQGTRLDGLQGFTWPRNTTVTPVALKAKKPANAGVHILPEAGVGNAAVDTVRVRVSNSAESDREQFTLRWSSASTGVVTIYVPPGQSRTVEMKKPNAASRVVLSGDDADFDNMAAYVPPTRQTVNVLYVGDETDRDPQGLLFYLKRAFTETARELVAVTNVGPRDPLSLSNVSLIVLGGAVPSEENAVAIRRAVDAGATLLLPVIAPAQASLASTVTGVPVAAAEASVSKYAMFGEIDFSHPLFSPFSDARFSDFTKIHFWKHRKITFEPSAQARVAARFDNGDPVVAQFAVGKGAVFLLGAGWHPVDGQLALSSKFVPLLYSMLEFGGGLKARALAYQVGDGIELGEKVATVKKPDGSEARTAGSGSFADTDQPGIYSAGDLTFAVNVPPEESRTAPMPAEDLIKLGVPVQAVASGAASPERAARKAAMVKAAEMEGRQKLWRWLIAATLVVLIVETILAARTHGRGMGAAT